MGKGDKKGKQRKGSYGKLRLRKQKKQSNFSPPFDSIISNRPQYLEDNLKYYNFFPLEHNIDVDYTIMPSLLNLDLHMLEGILPITTSLIDFTGNNHVFFANPSKEEIQYYKSINVTEFQAVQIIFNFFTLKSAGSNNLIGIPYNLSLKPMGKNGKIDTWNIDLLPHFDLDSLSKQAYVYEGYNPFKGWKKGYVADYSLFSQAGTQEYIDCLGFVWGMYFISPVFDKREVIIPHNKTYSKQINAKYRRLKTNLYFKSFKNVQPRRIWGCDSPIELFLLQGMHIRGLTPELQVCFYKNGEQYPNYYKMQESEVFIGEDKLLTSADFFFSKQRLAIFCDGKEFHDINRDSKIDENLKKIGIKSLRFSGKQITEDLESVLDEIEANLKII